MGAKHPMLPVYLRLARAFNVTLADLLTGRVSPDQIHSPDLAGVPRWRSLWARRRWPFDKLKIASQMEQALKESPPPSITTFQNRNGYHYATLRKHFPDQCRAIQERFGEYRAASIQQGLANKIAEFRQIAYKLHEQGTELFVNRVLTRMSVPKSLNHRIACELLAEIKREILAKERPPAKPCDKMAKERTSPDALRAQTE